MARRLGARAIVIYREEPGADDAARFAASIVFADPHIGLVLGGSTGPTAEESQIAMPDQALVQIKPGVDVPLLRAESVADLVGTAAGIVAYDDLRLREAMVLLEQALPSTPDAPNWGIANFYLGDARNLDLQTEPAATAYDAAIDFYEGRLGDGDGKAPPQDTLILVESYLGRGRLAALNEEWSAAIQWYTKGAGLREELVAQAVDLERESAVHDVYAHLFGRLAEAARATGKTEQARTWQQLAEQEIDAIRAATDADPVRAAVSESGPRLLIGDCVGAAAVLEEARRVEPANQDVLINRAIIAFEQGRDDLYLDRLRELTRLYPEEPWPYQLFAIAAMSRGVNQRGQFYEPTYMAEAKAALATVLDMDSSNRDARAALANGAAFRSLAATLDATANLAGDSEVLAKSSATWGADPTRLEASLDALEAAIDQRRLLALAPGGGSAADAVALNELYLQLHSRLFQKLTGEGARPTPAGGAPSADEARIAEVGREVHGWIDGILAEGSTAPRAVVLEASDLRVSILVNEWAWADRGGDPAATAALEGKVRQAITDAVAAADALPVAEADADEVEILRKIYTYWFHFANEDGDRVAASAATRKLNELEQAATGESSGSASASSCIEAREWEAGVARAGEGDLPGAEAHFEAALAANHEHLDSLRGLAHARFLQDDPAGAVAAATAAAGLAPDAPSSWARLGLYQVAAGDATARDEAYDRFFAVIDGHRERSQEVMANMRWALEDLEGLVERQPDLAPAVRELLPRFAGALDAMDDATGTYAATYQYPVLYGLLGGVALYADDAAAAEPLLRRSLELDEHAPRVRTLLALAVASREPRAAADEVEAAIEETRHAIWQNPVHVTPDGLLAELEGETRRFAQRFPERREAVRPLFLAIAAEREAIAS